MIDTTIRFNDHNSYKITSILMSYPFGVQNMTHITHSFQAYATTALASATRARTKFLDADGATLSEVSHSFSVTQVFGKVEITVAVPATATQAQLVLLQGGTDWWVAETKTEQGEVATPYNVNYQGQVSHLTPNGLYTGMVTANQIVVTGSIAQPDETLETRLVTINNGVINLSSTLSAKTTKITNEGVYTGEIEATQVTTGTLDASKVNVTNLNASNIKSGTLSVGGSGIVGEIKVKNSSNSDIILLNKNGITLADGAKLISNGGVLSTFVFSINEFSKFGFYDAFSSEGTFSTHFPCLEYYIPPNFVIENAFLDIHIHPQYASNGVFEDGVHTGWGKPRNVKVYKNANTLRKVTLSMGYISEQVEQSLGVDFTSSCFGTSSITPPTPASLNVNIGTSYTSGDIKSHFSTGNGKLIFTCTQPTFSGNWAWLAFQYSGNISGHLIVTGYKK